MSILDSLLELVGIDRNPEEKARKAELKAIKWEKEAKEKNTLAIAMEKKKKAKEKLTKAKAKLKSAKGGSGGFDVIGNLDEFI